MSEQLVDCCDCGRAMAIGECIFAECVEHDCLLDEHSCCHGEPVTDAEPARYEPEFDATYGIWIHDPCECRDSFHAIDYPPQCAWRAMIPQVEHLYEDIKEGNYIMVGYESIPECWGYDTEVEWALRKEKEGWSYHGIFADYGSYGYIKYKHKPVYERICNRLPFTPLPRMGPIAPRIYEQPFFFDKELQLKLHDPFGVIHMTQEGRILKTLPAHIRIASSEFWRKAIGVIDFSMAAYDNPKAGDVVRITEAEYTFRAHELPLTVRYLAEYDGTTWHPMMTIQHKGEEFIGFTHDWSDVDPVNPAPVV